MTPLLSAISCALALSGPWNVRTISLDYSTYLGGGSVDSGLGVAVENSRAFIVGSTYSSDFPTRSPFQASLPSINWDVFITAFSSSGSQLLYSSFLGGAGNDNGYAVVLESGEAVVTGFTYSSDFPTRLAYQSSLNNPPDAFVSRLSSGGSQLVFSTVLGGNGADEAYGTAVESGEVYLTGWTQSTDFPVRNAYRSTFSGGEYDAFVSKFSSDGSQIAYSTYLGGKASDNANGLAVAAGSAFVVGWTQSSDFPVLTPFQASSASPTFYDVFVTKLATSGSRLLYSTYLGGTDYDYGYGIAVEDGAAFIAGYTRSVNFPLQNAYQSTLTNEEAFVSKLSSSGSRLIYSTFLGGGKYDAGQAIAVVGGEACLAGYTSSTDFPVRSAYQSSLADPTQPDAFVSKLSSTGSRLIASTYLGGSQYDGAYSVAAAGEAVYITGDTTSLNFPTRVSYQSNNRGDYDAFVARLLIPPEPTVVPWIYDYNGDGTSDIGVFRGSTGMWSIRNVTRVYLGSSSDEIAPEDYNGDGTTDVAIFREASGLWSIRNLSRFYLGAASDQPVQGDYHGDGTAEAGIFRASSGLWSIRDLTRVYLGSTGDNAIPGYYSSSDAREIAVFRGSTGLWSVRNVTRFYLGLSTDSLAPGDYNGAGRWEGGIFRSSTALWAIRNVTRIYLGGASDGAIPADYDGDGVDEAAIFRGSTGLWSVQNLTRVYFGATGDIPATR
jgi:hypothetical protein